MVHVRIVVGACTLLLARGAGAFITGRTAPRSQTALQSTLTGGRGRAARTQRLAPVEKPIFNIDPEVATCGKPAAGALPVLEVPDVNSALELYVNLGQHGCALWQLSDTIRRGGRALDGSQLDRRSFVLGLKACCRLSETAAADEVHRLMNYYHGPGTNWRIWEPSQQKRVASAEEMGAMAELFALHGDHAQVFEVYAALQDQNANLPADSSVYISLIHAFRTVGADDFASSLLDELCGMPNHSVLDEI